MAKKRSPGGSTNWLDRVSASQSAKKSVQEAIASKKKERPSKPIPPKKPKPKKSQLHTPKIVTSEFELDSKILNLVVPKHSFLFDGAPKRPLKHVDATRFHVEMATILLQMHRDRGACLLLNWPNGNEWIGLSQVIANRYVSSLGGQSGGLRVLQYPSNRANSARYRNTHIAAESLVEMATSKYSRDGGELPERFHTYLALNALKLNDIEERKLNPSTFTLTPLLEFKAPEEKWRRIGGESLEEIRKALFGTGQYGRRDHLDAYAQAMDQIETTTEASLRVPPSVRPSEARRIIQKYVNNIDVICLDVRDRSIRNTEGWLPATVKIAIEALTNDQFPPVILHTDDPYHYKRIEYEVKKKLSKLKGSNHPLQTQRSIRIDSSPWKHEQRKLKNQVFLRQFEVSICGVSSLHNLKKINGLAQELTGRGDSEAATELRKLGGFLRGLTDSPTSQESIKLWIESVTSNWSSRAASNFAARYSWQEYKLRLLSKLDNLGVRDTPEVQKAISIADLVASSECSSEVEEQLLGAIEGKKGEKITIVFPTPRHIEPFCKKNEAFLRDTQVELLSQKDDLSPSIGGVLIVAGMVANLIPKLLLDDTMASRVRLICSGYGGLKLQQQLKILLEFKEFSRIHNRAQNLVDKLNPLLESFQKIGPIYVPSGEIILSSSESDHYGLNTYAVFFLEEYGELDVAEHSVVLKQQYDSDPMYIAVSATSIVEGDSIFVMEDDFKDEVERLVGDLSIRYVKDGALVLSQYLLLANDFLSQMSANTRTAKAASILKRMKRIDSTVSAEISENMLTRWIQGIEDQSGEAEGLRTQSAQDKGHFLLFAAAMLIESSSAQVFWDYGIKMHRTGKILEGKHLSSLTKSILCGAISPGQFGMNAEDIGLLKSLANRSTHTVSMIEVSEPDENDVESS
jgi:hypothetical protein